MIENLVHADTQFQLADGRGLWAPKKHAQEEPVLDACFTLKLCHARAAAQNMYLTEALQDP